MSATASHRMRDLLRRYSSFVTALESVPAYEVVRTELPLSTIHDIIALEEELRMPVPEDLRAFWLSDVRDVSIVLQLGQLRIAAPVLLDPIEALAIAQRAPQAGIPFRGGERYCYVDEDGSVRQRCAMTPVAPSFVDWFEHWLASGCWSAGADRSLFAMHWATVSRLVPVRRLPENNLWLQHLARVAAREDFPGRYGRTTGPAVWERM